VPLYAKAKKDNCLILDCHGICHTVRHALGDVPLTHEGLDTEVIFGFLRSLKSYGLKYRPERVVFVWDSQINFRKRIDSEYKAPRVKLQRAKTETEKRLDEIMYSQFNKLRLEVLPTLGFKNNFIQTGMEADDIIASIVYNNPLYQNIVVSGDADLYQLLSHCNQYIPRLKEEFKEKDFVKKYGIPVSQWVSVKAIAGCDSDNVKGITGVKETTAIKYLKNELPEHHKTFQNIINGSEKIKHNLRLVELPFEGTKKYDILEDKLNIYSFNKVFKDFGFESFLKDYSFMEWTKGFRII
jgi:5'-3' exonuclease